MALGVLISSFPYFGVPTLSQTFGYYAAPSSVQVQRIQISAQTVPIGGNITVALVNQSGTSYGAGAQASLLSATGYVDAALAAPITLSPGQVVRAIITEVDSGVASDLTVNLVGATAEGTPVPSGCGGTGYECAPPAAQLLFFKGSVAQEQAAAAASAAQAAASASAAAGSATAAAGSATAAAGSATAAAGSATNAAAQVVQAANWATNANNAATAASVYSGQAASQASSAAVSATAAAASAAEAQSGNKAATLELTPGSTQTIPDATPTAVIWNNAQFDDLIFWSAGQPTRITIPTGRGIQRVQLHAGLRWAADTTNNRKIQIRSNPAGLYGANSFWASDERPTGASGDATLSTPIITVEDGMYFEVIVEQDSGAPLDIDTAASADNHSNFFTIEVKKRA